MTWNEQFLALFRYSLNQYQSGNVDFSSHFTPEDLSFLESIGHQPRELFDFVEDFEDYDQPAKSTALLIAAVRRDYFLVIQDGKPSSRRITPDDLPTFGDTLGEIPYLPRIITKARAKLRGELDPDVMYCCGGDRKFLRDYGNINPADFLRQVWAAEENDDSILEFVKRSTAATSADTVLA